jgi:hypothetical protein
VLVDFDVFQLINEGEAAEDAQVADCRRLVPVLGLIRRLSSAMVSRCMAVIAASPRRLPTCRTV